MTDFAPGTVIERIKANNISAASRYVVLDPPRTPRGKLRLEGPRGGYMTTWWTPKFVAESSKMRLKQE